MPRVINLRAFVTSQLQAVRTEARYFLEGFYNERNIIPLRNREDWKRGVGRFLPKT